MSAPKQVERWGIFELQLTGPSDGNPFMDVQLSAQFNNGRHYHEAEGFYNGNGQYVIRFMPGELGNWTYETVSSSSELSGISGQFTCSEPLAGNHGPVRVKNAAHFHYADGTRFTPVGTTAYVWHLQSEELQKQTLQTLESAPFNKLRMCVFPKHYLFNDAEPASYPFHGSREQGFDLTRLNPAFFEHLEKQVQELSKLGIQADLILFHPYDQGRWGFDRMTPEEDERYLRYVIARLAAYRNVWWSMANEYDLMSKKDEEWDRLFEILQDYDASGHLRSIHNAKNQYEYGKPWITHSSVQDADVKIASDCTKMYGKPCIIDECGYEGNIHTRWGSLTPQEMLARIWEGHFRGGYVTHGETYLNDSGKLWWSHGGKLHGECVPRIAFLKQILEEAPENLIYGKASNDASTLEISGQYYLQYFGIHRFSFRDFGFSEGKFKVDIIDTWNMTVTPLEETFEGRFRIHLPSELYYAIRIRRVE